MYPEKKHATIYQKKTEVPKFVLHLIAQTQQHLEAGTDLHTFFQSLPLLV